MSEVEKKIEELRKTLAADELAAWAYRNLPIEEASDHALGVVSLITGSIIGAWLDAGASPELVKEYFSRFVDEVAKHV